MPIDLKVSQNAISNEEDLVWIMLDTYARQERCKNIHLKDKRKELNNAVKEFHVFHQSLKQTRRFKIKEVLKEFRDKNHKENDGHYFFQDEDDF